MLSMQNYISRRKILSIIASSMCFIPIKSYSSNKYLHHYIWKSSAFGNPVEIKLYSTEIKNLTEIDKKKVRVGGMVKEGSIQTSSDQINFIITDFKSEISVSYSGVVPNLFEEGKGVVAEGYLKDRSYFKAKKILAKHDENYMPPEVKDALKD